jgi:hypothetical protein
MLMAVEWCSIGGFPSKRRRHGTVIAPAVLGHSRASKQLGDL